MIVAGIDIGAGTTKGVILKDSRLLAYNVIPTGYDVRKASDEVIRTVLEKAGVSFSDLERIVSTGYGRHSTVYSDRAVSEIICHAKGVHFLIPEARVIIDIGCQDSKVMRLDSDGNVVDFVMNDKCAAGTGRFLEVMAKALELEIDELGSISLESKDPCRISSVCTVFAESEVVSLRAEGKAREDIIAGIHKSIASRIGAMMSQVGREGVSVLTGGVAKNRGVIKALEDELKITMDIPENPQITGALGAALIASEGIRT